MTEAVERTPERVPGPGAAVVLLLSVALLFVVGGYVSQLLFGEPGLLLAQLLFLLLPAVALIRIGGFDPRRTLSLRLPSREQVIGGVLFLVGGLQLALVLTWVQALFVPMPVDYLEAMADALRADSAGRFLWLVLIAAATPAIAEEVLFRGVFLASLRERLPAIVAVLIVGIVFGLFHLTPQTAFRFLPTAWLGGLLAWVVVASGSLPLAILLHFMNNTAVLALSTIPVTADMLNATEGQPPPVVVAIVGTILFVWGLRILHGAAAGRQGLQP